MRVSATLAVFGLLFTIACQATSVTMPYGNTGKVKTLTTGAEVRENLYREQTSLPSVLFIYDSLDINSMRLAPQIGNAAEALSGFADFFALDVREDGLQWYMDSWNVQITPSLKVLSPTGQARKNHKNSPLKHVASGLRVPVDYQEKDYHLDSIKKVVLGQLTTAYIDRINNDKAKNDVVKVATDALDEDSGAARVVMLFTDKDQTSQLYKALSLTYAGRARFIEVSSKAKAICGHFRVESFPSLMVFQPNKDPSKRNHGPVVYSGKLTIQSLTAFIDPYVGTAEEYQAHRAKIQKKSLKKAKAAFSSPMQAIKTLEDWHNDVLSREKPTAVLFTDSAAGEAHTAQLKLFNDMLKSNKGKKAAKGIKFVWVDKASNSAMSDFFVGNGDASEDLLVFLNTKKQVSTKYVGAMTAEGIITFIQGKLAVGSGAKPTNVADIPGFVEGKKADE